MSIPVGKLVKNNMYLRADNRLPSGQRQWDIMTDLIWSHVCDRIQTIVENQVKTDDEEGV